MREIKYKNLDGLLKVNSKDGRVWVHISEPTECFFLENQQEVDEFINKLTIAAKKTFN